MDVLSSVSCFVEKEFPSYTWKLGCCFEISRKEMGLLRFFPFLLPLGLASFLQEKDSIVRSPIIVGGNGSHVSSASFQGGNSAGAPPCLNLC